MTSIDILAEIVCGSLAIIISILFIIYNVNKFYDDKRLHKINNYFQRGFWAGFWVMNIIQIIAKVIFDIIKIN